MPGHLTGRTSIFRFKSVLGEKWTAGQGTKAELDRRNLSYFIFPQGVISSDGVEKEEDEDKEEEEGSK